MRDHRHTMTPATRRRSVRLLAPLLCLLVLGAVLPAAAQAKLAWPVHIKFGEEGVGAGQFKGPTGVAVDPSSGDVYVVDAGNARVEKFDAEGNFLLMFGTEVNENGSEICAAGETCKAGKAGSAAGGFGLMCSSNISSNCSSGSYEFGASGVAVDPETHDVYVADPINKRVEKFNASGGYLSTIEDSFSSAAPHIFLPAQVSAPGANGVAVDPVVDGAHGGHDLYVTDYGKGVVDVFDSAGTYLRQLSVSKPYAVAFDSAGNAYVISSAITLSGFSLADASKFYEFAKGEGAGAELSLEGSHQFAEALAVDSAGDLFVVEHEKGKPLFVAEYTPAGKLLITFGEGSKSEKVDQAGIAMSGTEAYMTSGLNSGVNTSPPNNEVFLLEEQNNEPPVAVTGPPENVTATTAMLTGSVNAEGHASTFWFKYGLTEAYGSETAHEAAGSGSTAGKVESTITGLEPHEEYHYRLLAENAFGETQGADEVLTTASEAPTISHESSSSVTQTEAMLKADINANNEEASWRFEYSTSPSMSGATSVPSPEGKIAAKPYGNVAVSQSITGLSANTVYFYRTVATNSGGGTHQGAIEEFRTAPPAPIIACNGVEEITDSGAVIKCTVNPASEGPSSEAHYFFEYSTTETPTARESYKCSGSCAEIPVSPEVVGGSNGGLTPEEVTAKLEGLLPLAAYNPETGVYEYTTYHWRLIAYNGSNVLISEEQDAETGDETFQTLPEAPGAATAPPVAVGSGSATVAGEVNTQGALTTYAFQYGTTEAYGQEVTGEVEAEAPGGGEAVTATLTGLAPDTTYHYRIVSKNSGGETVGEDRTFTTNAAGEPSNTPLLPGFSLTGPPLASPPALTPLDLTGMTPLPPEETTTGKKGKKPPRKSCKAKFKHMQNAKKRHRKIAQCKRNRRKHKHHHRGSRG